MKNIKINVDYFKKAAMFMAGFSLYQCLRIALTASSFALKRFGIPRRNLDIFITKIHNSMEVAIFLGILITTLYVVLIPKKYSRYNGLISVFTNWFVCLLFFVVLVAYGGSGQKGDLTTYYWGLVCSGFVMGMNQSIVMAVSVENISFFAGSIPFSGVQVSLYHILFLHFNKGKPNFDVDYWILVNQIIIAIAISGTAAILWTIGFIEDHKIQVKQEALAEKLLKDGELNIVILDQAKQSDEQDKDFEPEEGSKAHGDKRGTKREKEGHGGEHNRENVHLGRKGLKELIRRSTQFLQIDFKSRSKRSTKGEKACKKSFSLVLFVKAICKAISPIMMSTTAMGFVYLVFPAIAPYRLTNSDTGHKIDVSILITFVGPALINIALCAFKVGPNCDWSENKIWNYAWFFALPYFSCIIMFLIPAHYPEIRFSQLMTSSKCVLGFVCFMFALSHAVLKTVGFTGAGVQNTIKPVVITNTDLNPISSTTAPKGARDGKTTKRGAKPDSKEGGCEARDNSLNGQVSSFNILLSYLVLVIVAFFSDGYLKTLKTYESNRALWPTKNMSVFCALGFWISSAFRRGLRSFGEVFTLNVREQLMK